MKHDMANQNALLQGICYVVRKQGKEKVIKTNPPETDEGDRREEIP
jgi:hypothetical protein